MNNSSSKSKMFGEVNKCDEEHSNDKVNPWIYNRLYNNCKSFCFSIWRLLKEFYFDFWNSFKEIEITEPIPYQYQKSDRIKIVEPFAVFDLYRQPIQLVINDILNIKTMNQASEAIWVNREDKPWNHDAIMYRADFKKTQLAPARTNLPKKKE